MFFEHTLPWYWAPFCIWQCYHPYPPNVLEKMMGGVTMMDMQNVNCYANINWMHELEPNKGPLRDDDDDIIIPSIWSNNCNSYSISFANLSHQRKPSEKICPLIPFTNKFTFSCLLKCSFWLMIMLGFRQKLANNGTEAHMEEEDALAVGYEVRCAPPKLPWWLQLLVGWLISYEVGCAPPKLAWWLQL